jgi:hypothetical protein
MPSPRHNVGSWPGCDEYPSPVVGLGRNLLKRGVVGGLGKQRESTDSMVEHMMSKVSGDLYGFMPFHCRRLRKVCRASAQGLGSKPQERLTGLQRGRRSMLGEAPHNNKGA